VSELERELEAARERIRELEAERSDLADLQERTVQAQKMEAIGRLAGGVAHDFNNVLTAVIGLAELLQEKLEPGHPAHREAEGIVGAGERAAALVGRLLAFTRGQLRKPVAVDLNEVVQLMAFLLERVLGADIELRLDLDHGRHTVDADAAELEQVVLNLAVNARDAMPEGGVLTIETHAHVFDRQERVRLTVRDTGTGMDEATRQRVFEPFFTTKPAGAGTGLGLANVFGVVERAEGSIEVQSQPGVGTVFHLDFPARLDDSEELSQDDVSVITLSPGRMGVLVAEDDDAVREVVLGALEMAGYRAIGARDGVDALEQVDDMTVHILLTDVVMPRMGGVDLARTMRAVNPKLRVLFMSGYSSAQLGLEARDKRTGWLPKPFTPSGLLVALDELAGR